MKKIYLDKTILILTLATLSSIILFALVVLVEYMISGNSTYFLALLIFLSTLFVFVLLPISIKHKKQVFRFMIVDDFGMKYVYRRNVSKSIAWEEISKVEIIQPEIKYCKKQMKSIRFSGYLVFSSYEILGNWEDDAKVNFCIDKKFPKIYREIMLHFDKISNSAKHGEVITNFFN